MIYKDGDYKARLAPTKMIHNNSCKRNKLPKNLRRVISCCCCCCCIQSLRSETQKQQTKCLRLWIVLLMSWFGQTRCRATCQGETSTGYRLLLFGCATKHLACQFLLFHWNLYGFFVLRNNLWLSVLFVTIYAYLRSKPSTYSKTLQWANGHCNLSAVSFELFINKQTDHSSNFHLCFSDGLGVNRHKFVQAFCLTNNKMSQWDRKRDIVAWHIKCCQANKLLFSDSEAGASFFFFLSIRVCESTKWLSVYQLLHNWGSAGCDYKTVSGNGYWVLHTHVAMRLAIVDSRLTAHDG